MVSATRRKPFWASVSAVVSFMFALLPSICFAHEDIAFSGSRPTASLIPADNSSSTSSAAVQTHTISVGLADHKFRPETTNANIGDTIEFAFYPLNHSVVRAEYGFPCIPYEMIGQDKTGFFSGFKAVDSVLTSPPTYSIQIENTDPIFFYCSAIGSCINYGMVGVINPNMTTSIDRQHQLALDSSYMLNPGEPFPPEAPESSNIPTSSGTPKLSDDTSNDKQGLSTGAIAAIAIACSSVIIAAALLFFFWGRTKNLKDEVDRNKGTERHQGPNNTGPPAISETSHNHPTTIHGNEIGDIYGQYLRTPLFSPPMVDSAYQQYGYNQYNNTPGYNTPVPPYVHSPTPPAQAPPLQTPPPPPASSQQEPQQQQYAYKYDVNNAAGHPGYTIPPIQRQSPLSIHHTSSQCSLGGAFELSPTGDCTAPLRNNHTSPSRVGNNANVGGIDNISPSPAHPHGIASTPHVLATTAAAAATKEAEEAIPNYYEIVYRPDSKHINGGRSGPTEIDGKSVRGEIAPVRRIGAKWEEVGEKKAG